MRNLGLLVTLTCFVFPTISIQRFWEEFNPYGKKYGYFSENDRIEMLEATKRMFQFGYDNYIKYAFPEDELNPIYCSGRGHDHDNPYVSTSVIIFNGT